MNTIASFKLCTLTDEELLEKVDKKTDEIYKSCEMNREKPNLIRLPNVLSRHIPARPNDDYDLLVGELLMRFQERLNKEKLYNL